MFDLLYIVWNPDPVAFSIGPVTLRWYGLLYAAGFLVAIWLLAKMFKSEGCPDDWADKVFIYMVVAVIVGSYSFTIGHIIANTRWRFSWCGMAVWQVMAERLQY